MVFRQSLQLNLILSIYHQKCRMCPMQCFAKTRKESFKIGLFHIFVDFFDLLRSEKTNGFRGMKMVVLSGSTDMLIWRIITSLFWTKIVISRKLPIPSRNGNSRNRGFFNKQVGLEGPIFIIRINSPLRLRKRPLGFNGGDFLSILVAIFGNIHHMNVSYWQPK